MRNLAASNAPKVFAKLFPVARSRIISELKAGASSTRTLTTSIPLPSDAALHWWQSILYGMLIPGRVNVGPAGKGLILRMSAEPRHSCLDRSIGYSTSTCFES